MDAWGHYDSAAVPTPGSSCSLMSESRLCSALLLKCSRAARVGVNRFYHVSVSQRAKAIVASSDSRARLTEIYFSPKQPKSFADETGEPRVCVAPTVWQCLVSRPQTGPTVFIYSLRCTGAKPASSEEQNVDDAALTREHWISDDVTAQNYG